MFTITNEVLKSTAQDILKEFETGGASWEGVALEIARLSLSLEAIKKHGADKGIKIDLGKWGGHYCASKEDLTQFDPKCCEHDFKSDCLCCLGDCYDCKDEEGNERLV